MTYSLRIFATLAALLIQVVSSRAAEPAKEEIGCELLRGYFAVSNALADDDLKGVRRAAVALVKDAENDGLDGIATSARAIAEAGDIAQAREEFKTLTKVAAPLAAYSGDYVVMHCSMANADWVQQKGPTRNPYYGKAMLTCGAPKKKAD